MKRRTPMLAAAATALILSLAGAGAHADLCQSNKPGTYDPDNKAERLSGTDIDWKVGKFGPGYPPPSAMAMGLGLDWKICIQENPD